MRRGNILVAALWCITIMITTGCGNKKHKTPDSRTQNVVAVDSALTSKYFGILPAADCPGIRTTLILKWRDSDGTHNKFELIREFIDRDTFTSYGNFNVERGFGEDNDATVIILNYDKPQNERNYYVWFSSNPKTMHELTPSKELHNEAFINFTLEQVE